MKKHCDNCEYMEYICEGDYVCFAAMPPTIVKEEHIPSDNYLWCGGEKWEEADA